MGKSLEQYAAENPTAEPEQERQQREEITRKHRDRERERQEVDRLKDQILSQLKQGTAPQYILYAALSLIGILTQDDSWTKQGREILDGVYSDLWQESFLVDNEAVAAQRLEDMQREYNSKLKKQTTTQLQRYKKIEQALQDILKTIEQLEPEQTTEDEAGSNKPQPIAWI